MLNEVLKMIFADLKANVKQQEIEDLTVYYLQSLKYNVKRVYIFHLTLGGINNQLDIVHLEQGSGGFALNKQNLLSMMKVIY